MSTNEIPPAPGLTRENTGYPHDVYRGWFLTTAEKRRVERRIDAPPLELAEITLTAVCADCQALYEVTPLSGNSAVCASCRSKRATRASRRRKA